MILITSVRFLLYRVYHAPEVRFLIGTTVVSASKPSFAHTSMHIRVLHLPQQVVQLRCVAMMFLGDFGAEVPHVDQQAEGVSFILTRHVRFRLDSSGRI